MSKDSAQRLRLSLLLAGVGFASLASVLYQLNGVAFALWFTLAIGTLVVSEFIPTWRLAAQISCAVIVLGIVMTPVLRRLPIYSLPWQDSDRIAIAPMDDGWTVDITNPDELNAFARFGARGHYDRMMKGSTYYSVTVWRGSASTVYYIHSDAVGDAPGGMSQTVFIPTEAGLTAFVDDLVKKHRDN